MFVNKGQSESTNMDRFMRIFGYDLTALLLIKMALILLLLIQSRIGGGATAGDW